MIFLGVVEVVFFHLSGGIFWGHIPACGLQMQELIIL